MYCQYCGREIPDGAAFCGYCGRPTGNSAAAPAAPAKKKKSKAGKAVLAAVIMLALAASGFCAWRFGLPYIKYQQAEKLLAAGDYTKAADAFEALDDYSDAMDKRLEALYGAAEKMLEERQYAAAAKAFEALDDYSDAADKRLEALRRKSSVETLSAGGAFTVGIRSDGTVAAVGDNEYGQCNVNDWKDIMAGWISSRSLPGSITR